MENLKTGSDTLFILLGAIMVLAMHAGFAFLELGTVRKKNQVNALVKIITDFAVSTLAYFFIGYSIAYGVNFFGNAEELADRKSTRLNSSHSSISYAVFCLKTLIRAPKLPWRTARATTISSSEAFPARS